jgi:hypothetical protein
MSALPGMPEFKGIGDRIKKLEAEVARSIPRPQARISESIGSGGLRIKDDGSVQFVANDGTVILEIDKDAFTYDRADGTRQLEITPAGGHEGIYAANGTTRTDRVRRRRG